LAATPPVVTVIQDILAEPEWADVLGDADRRGLTPLFTSNMTLYGDIQLDTSRRLAFGTPPSPPQSPTETDSARICGSQKPSGYGTVSRRRSPPVSW
jgi:hypothetical protein